MQIENSPVLVLNKKGHPIDITIVREAINDVLGERARFVDPETYMLYNMNEWMDLDTSDIVMKNGEETIVQYPVIHSARREIRLPEVMLLKKYDRVQNYELRLNDRNLALRDGFCCQYCHKRLRESEITKDHVFPQSRGGKDSWENLVVACFVCNLKKGDRTPEEAKMPLLTQPRKPKWIPLTARMGLNSPESWSKFVKDYDKRPSVMV